VLPWYIDEVLSAFAYRVGDAVGFSTTKALPNRIGRSPFARVMRKAHEEEVVMGYTDDALPLIAHNSTVVSELFADEPFEIVAASPKIFDRLDSLPWDASIGTPTTFGQPCMALRLELRQKGRVAVHGTFFFTSRPPVVSSQ
jgi:hypothetical protein